MAIVLDTNVIISALLSPKGGPAQIMDRWEADEVEFLNVVELGKRHGGLAS